MYHSDPRVIIKFPESLNHLLACANAMQLLQSAKQKNFPKDLFDVRMYVLRPRRD